MKKVVRDLYESSKTLQKDSISGLFNFSTGSTDYNNNNNKENILRKTQSSLPELHKLSVSTQEFDPENFALEFPNKSKSRRSSAGMNRVQKIRTVSQSNGSTSSRSSTYTNVSNDSLWPYVNMFSKEELGAVQQSMHQPSKRPYENKVIMTQKLFSMRQQQSSIGHVTEEEDEVDEGMCTDSDGLSDSWMSCKMCSHHRMHTSSEHRPLNSVNMRLPSPPSGQIKRQLNRKSPTRRLNRRSPAQMSFNGGTPTMVTRPGVSRTRSRSVTDASVHGTLWKGDSFNKLRSPVRKTNSLKKSAILLLTPSKRQKSVKNPTYVNISTSGKIRNTPALKRSARTTDSFTYENLCPISGGKTLSQTNILKTQTSLPSADSSDPIYQNINPLPSKPVARRSLRNSLVPEDESRMFSMSMYEEMFLGKPRMCPPREISRVVQKPTENTQVKLVYCIQLDNVIKAKWVTGMAMTNKGNLVLVDSKQAYLLDSNGNLKRMLGNKGTDALIEPIAVTMLQNGIIAITDQHDQTVKMYTTKGQHVRTIRPRGLQNINGLAGSEYNDIFVVGTDSKCICVYNFDDTSNFRIPIKSNEQSAQEASQWFHQIPSLGLQNTRIDFEHPTSVAYNHLTRDVIVGDDHKQFVCAVTSSGRLSWKFCPKGERRFYPSCIQVTEDGYVFIGDLYNHKVYMLDSSGKYIKTLLSRDDGLSSGPGAIHVVTTNTSGHIYVADEEKTIKVYKYSDGFTMCRRVHVC